MNPKEMPGFRDMVKEQEEKSTRETDEAIKESPVLQELARICAGEIPLYEGFRFVSKGGDFKRPPLYLSYKYSAEADYQKVKSFYIDYFTRSGWRQTDQKDDGWGQRWVEFRKDSYKVKIFHGMSKEVNYAIHCEKSLDSDANQPHLEQR